MLLPVLAQLEAFVEVAHRRSVTAAAEALYVTQPALTARLNALERTIGAQLLVRRRRGGAQLTPQGHAFLPYAERALESVRDGRTLLTALAEGRAGQVAIGASPAVSTYALPPILSRFAATNPGVQLAVRTGHSEEVLELVKRERVDVALIRSLRDPEIESFTLYEDQLILVVHAGHRFAAAGRARLRELGEEQFLMFDRASSYHELTSALFRESGLAPRGLMELDNIDSAKKMVEQGLGIALLPKIAVADELRAGRLSQVRILGAQPVHRPIVAIRRLDAPPAPATDAFLRLLRAMRPELQAAAG
jgi:DNA-binding transcriptional LysR family regulator